MDEVDLLLETGFHTDFFGLIRSWHNNAAYDPTWEKLGLLLSISTEPYLLISDVHQSPFNIGLKLYLQDFDAAQVQELNHRHNSPVSQEQFAELMALLNGHPYLTRKALYTLVMERPSWHEFSHLAATDIGPFADHLRHQLWLLRDEPTLVAALKEVMTHQTCHDEMARFRLLRAGLINATGDVCTCRCDLYQRYFVDKL
jgi:hypothetical protein